MLDSDLRSRLGRLGYSVGTGQVPKPEPQPTPRPADQSWHGPHGIGRVVEGDFISTPHGECFVAEHQHGAGHPHGSGRLEEALEVEGQVFPWLGRDPALAALDLGRCTFLDLETTGLAGGTGTYAFLVGLGRFDGPRFVVRQFFMPGFEAEEALLHALAEALSPCPGVVTFNGKVFDLPLLETRFLMARRPFPLRGALHLDLLFPARRLWRERLESCALSALEREVLGVERESDIPGWQIPALYFDYLRTGDARALAVVFEHNRQDLLSLATLVTRLARQHADPFLPAWENAHDLHSLGVLFEGLSLVGRAALCYERSLALAPTRELQGRVMMRLGSLYRRMRQREDAVEVWRRLAASGHSFTATACVELAKHYEHAARDYAEAERLTRRALAALELRALRGEGWRLESERQELEHRLARLRRKLATSNR